MEILSGKEETIFDLKREQDKMAYSALFQTGPNFKL